MKAWTLKLIFGIALFISSMSVGMAQDCCQRGAQAENFISEEIEESPKKAENHSIDQNGLLPELFGTEQSPNSVENEQEKRQSKSKRQQKHIKSLKHRLSNAFFAKKASKGVAKHPSTQDPLEQRTAMIRFLEFSALI